MSAKLTRVFIHPKRNGFPLYISERIVLNEDVKRKAVPLTPYGNKRTNSENNIRPPKRLLKKSDLPAADFQYPVRVDSKAHAETLSF